MSTTFEYPLVIDEATRVRVSISDKENAPAALRQTTLALDGGNMKGKKRTLTLVDGDACKKYIDAFLGELDLSGALPATPQVVVEALRLRILQLEDQLYAQAPPAKRARTITGPATSSSSSSEAPVAGPSKAEEKKSKMQIKKIFDRLKKECKSDGLKFQGSPKTIKIDEVWEQSEFEAIFSGQGTLIQPTPNNKPKSTVTIIHFKTKAQVEEFFGNELKDLRGNRWTRGGGPHFAKSLKQGPCDVQINSFEVNYSKNGMKCSLKFEVSEVGGGYCPYGPSQRRHS
ncbi:uncharacterized protein LACBIDRAFT_333918 [Laccaria bicolor S238N-H82]|uniref:Predicted protein n=1 Tax=Laccaria bicolor (strain S238N-H82 / ATCC MYA-4686) TaxID=486041 RepID=B0DXI5_LACBS|nr:uncharacterized protein LACBIDRAFT_333918 [Laccaria bicolor S238N-H82]EDR00684.1 predicted protein [Laccaria bicolor S238N-H82]|eukprot:XP_001888693.1 predicted protein [Laccaria bicolor S238N-H82]